jgi:pSer/pThr/pTyr-binding forkhead associated (FHA) protein
VIAPMLLNKATVNSWVVAAPAFLASNLAMGAAVGACIGMAEALTRSAWLHLALTYGEGYTWTLDWPIARIGHAEGVEIRVEEMSGFAPVHAQIQRHGSDFAIQDLGFGTRLNGHQIPAAWLADNDVITLGPYEFIFHLRRPVTRRSHDLPPGAIIVSAEATSEGTRGAEPMRLEDDFGNSFPLAEQTSIVGRDAACEVTITWDGTVSRKHAEIVIGRNGAMIRDLGSSNGTRLNGRVIQSVKVPIKDGDVLEFGTARLTFRE